MTISIRDLRERVRVERAVLRINEKGELKEQFMDDHDIWACIRPKGYSRSFYNHQAHAQSSRDCQTVNYIITVRYDPTLQRGIRIASKDIHYYVIARPTHDAHRRWTIMEASVLEKPLELDHA